MKKLLAIVGGLALAAACGGSDGSDGSSGEEGIGKGTGSGSGGVGSTGTSGAGGDLATTSTTSSAGGGGPGAEACGNGLDDDADGDVDEGCGCDVGKTQPCFAGPKALAGKGPCHLGEQTCEKVPGQGEFAQGAWGTCGGSGQPGVEACNGEDDDCDGVVDQGCACTDGEKKPCSTKCGDGQQVCAGGAWGDCDAPQPDANGSCNQKVNINVDGDCVCAPPCPANVPFVVGCQIDFQGGNSNGCVATAKNGQVYFQEGVKCDAGHLTGFIICSDTPGKGLDASNCPINKSDPHYGAKPSDCPDIEGGDPDDCYY